jgi:hypothetical protein
MELSISRLNSLCKVSERVKYSIEESFVALYKSTLNLPQQKSAKFQHVWRMFWSRIVLANLIMPGFMKGMNRNFWCYESQVATCFFEYIAAKSSYQT